MGEVKTRLENQRLRKTRERSSELLSVLRFREIGYIKKFFIGYKKGKKCPKNTSYMLAQSKVR